MSSRPVAMVTGASRRVGLAVARSLAAAGLDLVLTHRGAEPGAGADPRGASVRRERLDLDDVDAVAATGARLACELPRLDVLVHNASVYGPSAIGAVRADDVLRNYRVNAASPLLLSAALAPLLSKSALPGGGCIVAMCDMHAMGRPRKDHAAYSMSKAALAEMVRSLARDLAPRVRVCGVAPGVVAFPEHGPESDPAVQQRYLSRVPLARGGTPEEAAEVVRWLALDAHYITGEIVRLDGGRWLA